MKLNYEAGRIPTKHELNVGEVAYNVKDGVQYTKLKDENVMPISYIPKVCVTSNSEKTPDAQNKHFIEWGKQCTYIDECVYSFDSRFPTRVTIKKNGLYRINAYAGYTNYGTDRAAIASKISVNGKEDILPVRGRAYSRGFDYNRWMSVGCEAITELKEGDYVEYVVTLNYADQTDSILKLTTEGMMSFELLKCLP